MGTNGRIVKRCHLRIFSVLFMKYLMDIEKKQRRKHRVKDLVQKFAQSNNKQTEWCIPEEGGGGTPGNSWWGSAALFSKS